MPIIIGLTGGIAGGKSAACEFFDSERVEVIDADIIAREVLEKGTVGFIEVQKAFPEAFESGELDRKILAEVIFQNKDSRLKLNSITFPLITKEVLTRIQNSVFDVVVLAAPLLFESGLEKLCKITVSINAPLQERIKRLVKRNNISIDEAKRRVESQLSDSQRADLCDYVITNDGTLAEFKEKIQKFYEDVIQKLDEVKNCKNAQ